MTSVYLLEQIVDLRLAWQHLALDDDEIITKSLNMRRIIYSQGLCLMRSFERMSDEKLMPDSFSHRTMSNLILWPHVLLAVETYDRELKSAQGQVLRSNWPRWRNLGCVFNLQSYQ